MASTAHAYAMKTETAEEEAKTGNDNLDELNRAIEPLVLEAEIPPARAQANLQKPSQTLSPSENQSEEDLVGRCERRPSIFANSWPQ